MTRLHSSLSILVVLAASSLSSGCYEPAPMTADGLGGAPTTGAGSTDGAQTDTDDVFETSISGSTGEPEWGSSGGGQTGEPGTGEPGGGETGGTDAGDDEGGTTGGIGCEPDPSLLCVEPAPQGWVGPVALSSDPELDASHCGGNYPELLTTGFSDLLVPEADCGCECGSAVGGGCSGTAQMAIYPVSYELYSQLPHPQNLVSNVTSCHSSSGSMTLDDDVFTTLNEPLPARFFTEIQSLAASGGQCAPIVTGSVPPAELTGRADLCAPAEVEPGCDGTVCVPSPAPPFDASVCVWQDGVHECPADAGYTEQSVYYRNHEDTRACGSCSCSEPTGSCPDAHVDLYFSANFLDTTELWPGQCVMENQHEEATAARFEAGQPDWSSCQPSAGTTVGNAAPTDPITVCCTP